MTDNLCLNHISFFCSACTALSLGFSMKYLQPFVMFFYLWVVNKHTLYIKSWWSLIVAAILFLQELLHFISMEILYTVMKTSVVHCLAGHIFMCTWILNPATHLMTWRMSTSCLWPGRSSLVVGVNALYCETTPHIGWYNMCQTM